MSWKFWGVFCLSVFVVIPSITIFVVNPSDTGDADPTRGDDGEPHAPSWNEVARWLANDYYGALELSRGAEVSEIKSSYRSLSKTYHPDVAKTSDTSERMRQISEAYGVLKNARKRAAYDAFIANLPPAARPVFGTSRVGFSETAALLVAIFTLAQYVFLWVRFREIRGRVKESPEFADAKVAFAKGTYKPIDLTAGATAAGDDNATADADAGNGKKKGAAALRAIQKKKQQAQQPQQQQQQQQRDEGGDPAGTSGGKLTLSRFLKDHGFAEPSVTDLLVAKVALLPLKIPGWLEARREAKLAESAGQEKTARIAAEREARRLQEEAKDRARREEKARRIEERIRQEEEMEAMLEKKFEEERELFRRETREVWAKGGDAVAHVPYEKVVSVVCEKLFPLMEGMDADAMEEQLIDTLVAGSHSSLRERIKRGVEEYRDEIASDAA